jgi:hypothetical protein
MLRHPLCTCPPGNSWGMRLHPHNCDFHVALALSHGVIIAGLYLYKDPTSMLLGNKATWLHTYSTCRRDYIENGLSARV